jgi:hypothetical protein
MKATNTKKINTSKWSDLYDRVVNEIINKETTADKNMKEALKVKFDKSLKGKDLVIQNSCR